MTPASHILFRHHSRRLAGSLSLLASLWVVGICLLQFINHPWWLILIGAVFAFWLSIQLAGADIVNGSEEFSFSLPATRSELFWTRFLIGFLPLVLFCVAGSIALYFDIPRWCWGMLVDSGLTDYHGDQALLEHQAVDIILVAAGCLVPPIIYSLLFSVTSLVSQPRSIMALQLVGLVCLIFTTALLMNLGSTLSGDLLFVLVLCFLGLVMTGLLLLAAWFMYRRKPGISHGAIQSRRGGAAVLVVGLVLLVVFIMIVLTFFFSKVSSGAQSQAHEAERRAMEAQWEAESRIEESTNTTKGEN